MITLRNMNPHRAWPYPTEEDHMSKVPASLKQKMAKSVAGSAPSLLPGKPREIVEDFLPEDVVPPIDQLIADKDDVETLRGLIRAHLEINQEKKALEKKVDNLSTRIKSIIGQYGIEKAVCDGANISYYPVPRRTINGTKLLGAGVPEETITLCTDVSTSYTLKITAEKI